MPGSEDGVTDEAQRLQRYLDGDLSPAEAAAFRAELAVSPTLRRELAELERVGELVRDWAEQQGRRAEPLLEQTMLRAVEADHRQRRHLALGVAMAAGLLLLLPSAHEPFPSRVPVAVAVSARPEPAAAIERLEAVDRQAQVFVVGSSSTPVVWLVDDVEEEAAGLDPG